MTEPTNHEPTNHEPTNHEPTSDEPTNQQPDELGQVDPAPVEVDPVEVDPVEVDPVEADPVAPDHVVPAGIAGIASEIASDAPQHRVAADLRGRTISEADYKSLSRRSVLTGGAGALAAVLGWRWIQGRPVERRIPDVLRSGHEANEAIWSGLFRDGAKARTYDFAESSAPRVNGRHGIRDPLDLERWELRVVGRDGSTIGRYGVEDLRGLPQHEMTVQHYCVEGWSHIVTWGGVVFADFVERFHPEEADAPFVGLSTPDGDYEVGLERAAMMHSQTMLTLDLQREPLTEEHGAPVRLTTPLKYGIKQIKRIGTITFSEERPANDYWAERGYDWYAAL